MSFRHVSAPKEPFSGSSTVQFPSKINKICAPDVTFSAMSGVYYIRRQLHVANVDGTNKFVVADGYKFMNF